MKLIYKC